MSRIVNCFQYFDARQHFNDNDHQKLAEFLDELKVDRFKSLKLA
jgi:site-specific DNA-adenine methylase